MKKRLGGFTLVEVLIVVVIVSILSAVAFPAYRTYVMKSRRVDATSALLAISAAQEKRFLDTYTYTSSLGALGRVKTGSKYFSDEGLYELSITSATTSGYTIQAAVVAGESQQKDTDCQTMTLDSSNLKTPGNCW